MKRIAKAAFSALIRTLAEWAPALGSSLLFLRRFGRRIDLKHPKTLNEKIMWLKLNTYRNNELVERCADKLRVRDYVREKGCADTLNELYAAWESADQIPWAELPDSFVLKCNHGCGFNLLVPDKREVDEESVKRQLDDWMDRDFWRDSVELQYRNIPRRILCERYMKPESALYDYKLYCFNGVARYVLVCVGRESGSPAFYFFDREWNFCPITRDGKKAPADFMLPRPGCLEEMLECAEKLSVPFPFVRVDLYDVDGRVVFGELTFTPAAALDTGRLPETDVMFGGMLRLPEK